MIRRNVLDDIARSALQSLVTFIEPCAQQAQQMRHCASQEPGVQRRWTVANKIVQEEPKERAQIPWLKANLRVRGITLSTQNCIQAGSCSQGGLGHINKHNSESSTLRTNFCHGPVTGTVTEISSRTEFVHFALCDAADVRELDAVVDAVGRGVGPDDGPDLADAGFEHSARHDTRNRRSGRSSAGASPAAAGPSHHC